MRSMFYAKPIVYILTQTGFSTDTEYAENNAIVWALSWFGLFW